VTGAPLETTDLIKLNFHRVRIPLPAETYTDGFPDPRIRRGVSRTG
jgi:hypothetical protein